MGCRHPIQISCSRLLSKFFSTSFCIMSASCLHHVCIMSASWLLNANSALSSIEVEASEHMAEKLHRCIVLWNSSAAFLWILWIVLPAHAADVLSHNTSILSAESQGFLVGLWCEQTGSWESWESWGLRACLRPYFPTLPEAKACPSQNFVLHQQKNTSSGQEEIEACLVALRSSRDMCCLCLILSFSSLWKTEEVWSFCDIKHVKFSYTFTITLPLIVRDATYVHFAFTLPEPNSP